MYVVGGGGRFAKKQVLSCCKCFSTLREFNQSGVDAEGILIAQMYSTYLGRYVFVPNQEQPGGYI